MKVANVLILLLFMALPNAKHKMTSAIVSSKVMGSQYPFFVEKGPTSLPLY